MNRSTAWGVSLAALLFGSSGSAVAQEFFLYPPCTAHVEGTLRARGTIATTLGTRSDEDASVLDADFPIVDASALQFFGGGHVAAGVRGRFDDGGCRTAALSEADGRMRYGFTGDSDSIRIVAGSLNDQLDIVRRDATSAGVGGLVTARSIFDLAGHNQMRMAVPFTVGGGNGAVIHVDTFSVRRTDSGPSDGYSFAEWAVYADENGNCQIDRGEPIVATGQLRVGPNERAAADPTRFAAPRGNYVLTLTKEMSSDVGVASRSCATPARAASEIREVMTLAFSLVTGG
ncbi:MAG: hypothetical protein HYR85_13840 [Planctomycetes bacterium]|nr:hypothetical protein [Planctomycetota bacterium]MBI3843566.1 hypothetical protein [Planctomycetota bacterium]